jgi:hypothetical protein
LADPSVLVAAVAAAGALAAGATALSRPRLALGILFLLAAISRLTLETPLGTMRPEMPAIAVVAVVLLAGGRFSSLRDLPRSTVAMTIAFGTFLGALTLSSAFIAPGTSQSLHMVAWFAVSMTGGVVAFVLMRPRPLDALEPFAFGGAAMGFAGILVATAFLVAGPGFNIGIQDPNSIRPRVHALGWETNLYASFLGMCTFLALESARGLRRAVGWVGLAIVLIGFALGITRGAYVGLAAGFLAYGVVRLAVEHRPADLPRLGTLAGALLIAGIAASEVLLPNNLERLAAGGGPGPSPSDGGQPSTPGGPPTKPTPTSSAAASATPTRTPLPTLTPDYFPDTLGYRLDRVPVALGDLPDSPLIGFGAESFGQKHPDRSNGPYPDHIAILAVVVPYEAGAIGAAGLAVGFVLLMSSLWRAARRASQAADWRTVGAAAAFIASLVSILVAYEVTNALQFAANWMVVGAATALTLRETHPTS